MAVALVVGTKKGAAILKSDNRKNRRQDFALKGWAATASARDDKGGVLRPSIVFLHEGALVRAGDAAARALKDGDEIVLTNALSGG